VEKSMSKTNAYKDRIREFLAPLADDQWRTGGEIAFACAAAPRERASIGSAISLMRAAGELLRSGQPPRGCKYRLNPDYVPDVRDPAILGPAAAYESPIVGDGPLCPSVGTPIKCMLPEAA
jgi:hypothetical protein